MNERLITCVLCGHQFDPSVHAACSTCPLNRGCQMACCPVCGATNINTQESRLVQWIQHLRGEKRHAQPVE